MALFDYIEGWFNNQRRHSSLGMLSPTEFDRRWRAQAVEA
jgi:transposase InsO family protein